MKSGLALKWKDRAFLTLIILKEKILRLSSLKRRKSSSVSFRKAVLMAAVLACSPLSWDSPLQGGCLSAPFSHMSTLLCAWISFSWRLVLRVAVSHKSTCQHLLASNPGRNPLSSVSLGWYQIVSYAVFGIVSVRFPPPNIKEDFQLQKCILLGPIAWCIINLF